MGDRNHLHVCRHCGIVHATASSTTPERCLVCGTIRFSCYVSQTIGIERAETETSVRVRE